MNVKLLVQIQKLRPQLRDSNGFLYAAPVGQVLCGFVFERIRGFRRIWKFALPLYDRVEFLHLGFSAVVGQWEGKAMTPKVEAARFVECIANHEPETYSWADPEKFLSISERQDTLGNPWNRRGAALTRIVLGDASAAKSHLRILLDDNHIDRVPCFRRDLEQID